MSGRERGAGVTVAVIGIVCWVAIRAVWTPSGERRRYVSWDPQAVDLRWAMIALGVAGLVVAARGSRSATALVAAAGAVLLAATAVVAAIAWRTAAGPAPWLVAGAGPAPTR